MPKMNREEMIDLIVNRDIEHLHDWKEGSLFKMLKFGFAGYVSICEPLSDEQLKTKLIEDELIEETQNA